ncbi:hypothetical protein WIW50_04530 [Flavobacteriaceae bacterium 3-367]
MKMQGVSSGTVIVPNRPYPTHVIKKMLIKVIGKLPENLGVVSEKVQKEMEIYGAAAAAAIRN